MTVTAATTDALTRDALAVLQPAFDGTDTAPSWLLRRLENGLTGVGVFGRNVVSPEQLAGLTGQLRSANPEALISVDEEGGDVTRLDVRHGSASPGNHALGAVDDPDLTRAVAAELGRRLAECGVNLNWAPSADVNSDPRNPVIGIRSFGDDPELVARHTVAYVEGLQSAGVAACVKHFPGHGDTDADSHHALPTVGVDLETLHSRELVPFKAAVAAGTRCVMSAHLLLPALDPTLPGTVSPAVLDGLLRAPVEQGGLGFTGLIFTDAMDMDAVAVTYGQERAIVMAIAAGADAVCVAGTASDEAHVLRLRDALVTAVRAGELSEERLHQAAERVRELGRWTVRAQRQAAAVPPAPEIGLAAARRAVAITRAPGGAAEPLTRAPYVATFSPVANMAAGDETPWGVGPELERLLPGTVTGSWTGESAEEAGGPDAAAKRVLAAAGDRPLVAVVRDAHRHGWMGAALAALVAARPDTVVIEMGVPQAPATGALHVATHGAARVCAQAAAETITGLAPSS